MLIVGATWTELAPLAAASSSEHERSGGRTWPHLHRGTLGGVPVILAATGIGKVNTAAAIATVNATNVVRAVLQVGIGGAYPAQQGRDALAIGDVAVAESEYDLDLGVGAGADWRGLDALGFPVAATDPPTYNRIPCHAAASVAVARALDCPLLPFATSDGVTADPVTAERIATATGAAVESMEGAAGALASLTLAVPFVEVRGISNAVGDRDKSRWRIPAAIDAATAAAILALPALATV